MSAVAAVPLLQAAVTPCIIISGVGLLVLSMSNRFARPIDRVRALLPEVGRCNSEEEKELLKQEIKLLWRRAKLLQKAIFFAVLSIFFVALIIALIFVDFMSTANLETVIKISFACCMISLAVGLVFYMRDFLLTLESLQIEIVSRHKVVDSLE